MRIFGNHASSSPSLASSLFVFLGVSLLPLLAFAVVQAGIAASNQKRMIERAMLDEARALSVAVQNQVVSSFSALNTLAASTNLDTGNVAAFSEEAARARAEEHWYSVWLAGSDGHQLMNLARPPGEDMPSLADRDYFRDVLRTERPAVSGPASDALLSGYQIAIAVPVLRGGQLKYVLAAGMRPEALSAILASAGPRDEARIASVIDRHFVILARTRDAGRSVGRKASDAMVEAIGSKGEGLVETRTFEGLPVYTAFVRIPDTRWVVTVALSQAEVEGPLRRMLLFTVGSGLVFFLVAGGISVFLVRRMTKPIGQLVSAARDIADGKAVDVPAHQHVKEIATLADALRAASEGTRERQRLAREFAFRLQRDVEDERRRIARSFHDDLGQRLTLIAMAAEIMRGKTAEPEHHRMLDSLGESVRAAVVSMRNIIAGIRPPEMDLGIAHALEALLDTWSGRSGIASELETEGEFADLPESMLVALYRIVQEALNNVSKHASATKVRVELRRVDGEVRLTIRDNGVGMDVDAASRKIGHFGLFGIGERAAQFGGSSSVTSTPGAGTTIRVVLPVPDLDDGALAREAGGYSRNESKERARARTDARAEKEI